MPRDLALVLWVTFAFYTALDMYLPVFSPHLAGLGAGPAAIGFVVGLMSVVATLVRPWFGRLCDRVGRRATMVVAMLSATSCGLLYLAFDGLLGVTVVRLWQAVGLAAVAVGTQAAAADLAPLGQRGRVLGWQGVADSASLMAGPLVSGALAARGGTAWSFWGIAVTAATGLAAALAFAETLGRAAPRVAPDLPAARDLPAAGQGAEPWTYGRLWRSDPVIRLAVALNFIAATSMGLALAFIPVYAPDFGPAGVALYFSIYAVTSILGRLVGGRLVDRAGPRLPLVPATALAALGTALPALEAGWALFAGAALMGVGRGASQTVLLAVQVDAAPAEARGMAVALINNANDLGLGVPLGLGLVAQAVGYGATFAGVGLAILVAGLPLALRMPGYSPSRARTSPAM